jgi:hypothetical protein
MQTLRCVIFVMMLLPADFALAWWQVPYAQPYTGYWPNAWPALGGGGYAPAYGGYGPYNYPGSDWRVKGYMTERGDVRFIMEYRGNIYNDMFGGYPGYNRPYYGGWR